MQHTQQRGTLFNRKSPALLSCFLSTMLLFSFVCKYSIADDDKEKATVEQLLQSVLAVGPEGTGHAKAIEVTQQLQKANLSQLIPILSAFDQASPLALNWLAGIVETIADRELNQHGNDFAKELETFVRDRSHSPKARRLAYDIFQKISPKIAKRMIPGMLNDPSPELRRMAVSLFIDRAKEIDAEKEPEKSKTAYLKALTGASDDDHVKTIVKALKKVKHTVNLQKHYGYLNQWFLVGPFDNTDEKGFSKPYTPEKKIDLDAQAEGKLDKVSWKPFKTTDEYGILDIAEKTAPHKGAITYATTTFLSSSDQLVEFRLSTPNAWKMWVNGKLLFEREEYHRGTTFDQYRILGKLKKGKNRILLKICQNEQEQSWAQKWQFQLRVCNLSGLAIKSE